MKFGQLIGHIMRSIFLEKSCTKCGRETIPSPFLKYQNWAYLWIKVLYILFVCQVEDYWKWLKLSCRPFGFSSYKAFLKHKKWSGTTFSTWILKKNISVVIFYYLTNFQYLVAFTSWDIGQYVHCSCLLTRLWH